MPMSLFNCAAAGGTMGTVGLDEVSGCHRNR